MTDLFTEYEDNPEWTVLRGLPATPEVENMALIVAACPCCDEAHVQPRVDFEDGKRFDAAYRNLHTTEETE